MSNALSICAEAYRLANMDQELTSFATTQAFPYNNAMSLLKQVIQEMNRLGNYWFCENTTALAYAPGTYQYSFAALGVDHRRVTNIRREAANQWGVLTPCNWKAFRNGYRQGTIQTVRPTVWAKYGDTLELNSIPDQDYSLTVYHFKDIALPVDINSTFPVPASDEDVLVCGVYAYLLQTIGRPDFEAAYPLFIKKARDLLADMKQDQGMPFQMPSNF